MNKKLVIKTYQIMMIILVTLIAITGIMIIIFGDASYSKGIGFGITIGVLIGGFLSLKFKLPKMFKNKDERTLTIKLVSTVVSQSVFAIASYMCFALTAVGLIDFSTHGPIVLLIIVFAIVALVLAVDKLTYHILCKKA